MYKYTTIRDLDSFKKRLAEGTFKDTVVQGVDLEAIEVDWLTIDLQGAAFLGCRLSSIEEEVKMRQAGARVIAPFADYLPYRPFRTTLYTPDELMHGYEEDESKNNCLDARINRHFDEHGGHDADILEALAQRVHDYSIDEAIKVLLGVDDATGLPGRKAVGIMGGHLERRGTDYYRRTALLAAELTKEGYFVVSGGGPGIMEAANLGACFAHAGSETIHAAIDILSKCPEYQRDDGRIDPGYVRLAQQVLNTFARTAESLAIPTWFYGHEPVNLFATYIGKYFSNSIREDGLLAISVYGVVYAPGSAATTQEVFADAAQNHYATFDWVSPMVFLGANHYLQSQVYSCLTQQAAGHPYAQMITISDEPVKLVEFIKKHKPINKSAFA